MGEARRHLRRMTPPRYERGTVVEMYTHGVEGESHKIGTPFTDKHMRVGIIVGLQPELMKRFGVETEELDHWEYTVLIGMDKVTMHEDDVEVSTWA